jgi:type I restriction enzyme S subunit
LREELRNGWSPKCQDAPPGTPVLRLGAVLGFEYNPSEIKFTQLPVTEDAHYWLKPGDILISRSNTPTLVGHAAIYSGVPSPCIYPDLLIRLRVDMDIVDPQFVVYWLRGREIRDFVASRARGASSTMKKISQQDLREMPFPKVDLSQQKILVGHLDEVRMQVRALQRAQRTTSADLDRLEQSILARAFRGEL